MTSANNQTIVFTDSGLGGLSIMADFYNSIKNAPVNLDELNIVFFNAFKGSNYGYNQMSSEKEKVRTFNDALETISKLYNPNQIAIACNTLSSIYPKTLYGQKKHNVLEIISSGISQIKQHVQQFPTIPVFVLATPTTIASGAYKLSDENIIQVSGDNLASLIEFNYLTPELRGKVNDILKKIKNPLFGKIEFSLFFGCTHYAYIKNMFIEVSKELGLNIHTIIDPADKFNRDLISKLPVSSNRQIKTRINLKIESQAEILPEEIISVSSMLKDKSPEISSLLKKYTRLPKTF